VVEGWGQGRGGGVREGMTHTHTFLRASRHEQEADKEEHHDEVGQRAPSWVRRRLSQRPDEGHGRAVRGHGRLHAFTTATRHGPIEAAIVEKISNHVE
jgi:hypothetical protein